MPNCPQCGRPLPMDPAGAPAPCVCGYVPTALDAVVPARSLLSDSLEAPEWPILRDVLRRSAADAPDAWAAFAACRSVEVYTDGSAPLKNPGGPAGFAAVVVGFAAPVAADPAGRPAPVARLDLGGHVPPRREAPATSNNRAEIAGVLTALGALISLPAGPWRAAPATVWSDSSYTVMCGNGTWQRKKNTDLWPLYDACVAAARSRIPGLHIAWLKGHAANAYNEAADELATRAALDFDAAVYARYRAAQAATGREVPGATAVAAPAADPAPTPPPAPAPRPLAADTGAADYAVLLHTRLDGPGLTGPATGRYRVTARDGRSRDATVRHAGPHAADEAEYHTLRAALTDIADRIRAAGRAPADYTVTVTSPQELMVKQLTGAYRVKAAALQAPYAAARAAIAEFGRVDLIWQPAEQVKRLFP